MAYSAIPKSTSYFNTKLYTGNGSTNTAQTGVGFQPDWTWIKERSSTSSHILTDAVRGANKSLSSNLTGGQSTETQSLMSFDSDGFTVGSGGGVNENSQTYAAWNWKANGTATAYGDTYAANDIIGIALDMTNGFLYFSKNGTWQNSGNPESGASGTNAAYGSISGTIGSHAYDGSSTQTHEYSFNFGNGYFGTTAVTSAGTGASTPGTFEYNVPNGYQPLTTKGLNL